VAENKRIIGWGPNSERDHALQNELEPAGHQKPTYLEERYELTDPKGAEHRAFSLRLYRLWARLRSGAAKTYLFVLFVGPSKTLRTLLKVHLIMTNALN
jgi:hypothetical protein